MADPLFKRNIFESGAKMPKTNETVSPACNRDEPNMAAPSGFVKNSGMAVEHARSPRVGEQV